LCCLYGAAAEESGYMRKKVFGLVVLLGLTVLLAKCASTPQSVVTPSATPPAPTQTSPSLQLAAAQALCSQGDDQHGTLYATDTQNQQLTQLAFYTPFILHAQFPLPIILPAEDVGQGPDVGASFYIVRIDSANTMQEARGENIGLGNAVGTQEFVHSFQLPITSANDIAGQPIVTTPGIYCLALGVSGADGSANGISEVASLAIEVGAQLN
jgi:hypothetical protein